MSRGARVSRVACLVSRVSCFVSRVSCLVFRRPMTSRVSSLLQLAGRQKSVQTDVVAAAETGGGGGCGCDAKYNRIFSDFKERLATDHAKERDESLRKLEERVRRRGRRRRGRRRRRGGRRG